MAASIPIKLFDESREGHGCPGVGPGRGQGRRSFTLTEILLVLGILGFAVVPLLALIALGVETNRVSAEESGAVNLASSILADLRKSPLHDAAGNVSATSARFSLPMPLAVEEETELPVLRLDASGRDAAEGAEAYYQVRMTYYPSGRHGTPPDRQPARVSLRIIWPGQASDANAARGRWECVAAFPQEGADWR